VLDVLPFRLLQIERHVTLGVLDETNPAVDAAALWPGHRVGESTEDEHARLLLLALVARPLSLLDGLLNHVLPQNCR
jgi:hypothetical protein